MVKWEYVIAFCLVTLFASRVLFADTPQFVEVTGENLDPDVSGIYEKQSTTHGSFNHEYWMRSDGAYYIYSDDYCGSSYNWNIDANLSDDDELYFYSELYQNDPTQFAALVSPHMVYDQWQAWYGQGTVVVSEYGVTVPEINVIGNDKDIDDEEDTPCFARHTHFGSAQTSSGTTTRIFTIKNTGTAGLSISNLTITGDHASDFSVTHFPDPSVNASCSTTFTVKFSPSAKGDRNATVTIFNNDSTEGGYNFNIKGYGFTPVNLTVSNITAP